jgi:hypothetical protein
MTGGNAMGGIARGAAALLALAAPAWVGASGIRASYALVPAKGGWTPLTLSLGVEYAFPGLAASFAATAVPVVKPYPDNFAWGHMQNGPDAAIDFSLTDSYVREYQQAGFTDVVLALKENSSWASRGASDPAPQPQYLDAYAHWVGAVVERYDDDGHDDMPGLLHPVRFYEIGTEFSTYEPEPVDEYLEVLEAAYGAAHEASSTAQVAHAAFLVTTAFKDDPTADEYAAAFAAVSPRIMAHSLADLRAVLDRPDLFDLVNFHALGEPDEIAATVSWLRWEMAQRGYDRPIIVSDTATTPFIAWGPATRCTGSQDQLGLVIPPATEDDRCRLAAYFAQLVAGDPATVDWTHAFAASDLVEKAVVAAASGVRLLDTWSMEDIPILQIPLAQAGAGTAAWAGMADVTVNLFTGEHAVRDFRPAFYALQQLETRLSGCDCIRAVNVADPRVRLFELRGPVTQEWIAWLDPATVVLPGDAVPTATLPLVTGPGEVTLERTPTRPGQTGPDRWTVTPDGGVVELPLTPTPLFVIAASRPEGPARLRRRLARVP